MKHAVEAYLCLFWAKVYELFDELPKEEQVQLFKAIQTTLFPESKEDIAHLVGDIREVRFSGGLACVHCGNVSVKRNGKYRSRQRYLCKDCGKTFNDMTASPISGTHYPHKWLKYFKLMLEGMSLPQIAEELRIHVATAFYWRHKILNALRSQGFNTHKGIIESDENYFLESDKGKRQITNRRSRKRGGVARKRGISNEQISVIVAHDRNGNILSKNTDSATNYKLYAKKKAIPHEVLNGNKGERVKKGFAIFSTSTPTINV